MNIITEKSYAEQSSIKSVATFFNQYRISYLLKRAGAYKQKGISVSAVVKYLIALIYSGRSMFQDMRSATPFAQGFCKDTVYRLLNMATVNWQAFQLSIAFKVVKDIDMLTSEGRRCAYIIDDSFFQALYAKRTELVSWVHDHAEKSKNKFKRGFRMLTLCWSDGVSLIPLAFRHLASADEKKQLCGCKVGLDKRSCAYKIRREAVSKATDVLLLQLKAAIKAGITAKYALFDSWFAYPATIIKVAALGLFTTSRVKDTTTIKYLVNGEKKTAKEIFKANKKRRGKSRYLLSVPVTLYTVENKVEITLAAKLVYIRNRNKRNDWIALITTDLDLTEEDVIALYAKRWDIEVFFKICKSYLKLTGEFQQLSYDAIVAHTTIVMIRYMILSLEKRKQEDPRSLGELFYLGFDEVSDIKFDQAIMLLMSLLADTLRETHLGLTEEQMGQIMDSFIQKLPQSFRVCLQPCFAA
jgi:hypothetical protein